MQLRPWSYPIVLVLLLSSSLVSCSSQTSETPTLETQVSKAPATTAKQTQDTLTVYATNYPLKYFAERIAGNTVTVKYLIPDNIDPAFWQPKPADITQMQKGNLIFINGATYEKWLVTTSLPESKLIDTSASFQNGYIKIKNAVTHSHGPTGKHSHTGTAFTTWLNFEHAIAQADAVRAALTKARPELADTFQTNFKALKQDLQTLDEQLKSTTATNPNIPLVASHPVYDYLAQRYSLNLKSVLWEPDEVPNEVQWQELKNLLKKHPAQWMLWEGTPDPKTVAQLNKMGIESIVLSPAGNTPETGDFMMVMKQNIQNLKQIY